MSRTSEPDARDRLLNLLSVLYAAPGEPDRWQVFLHELCSALDGTGANFISMDFTAQQGSIALTARTDPAAIRNVTKDRWENIGPTLRIHAGLEDVDDLIADLEKGFDRLTANA